MHALRMLFSVVVLISKQILVTLKDGKALYFFIPMLKSNLLNKTILNLHLHTVIIEKELQKKGKTSKKKCKNLYE